MERRKKIALELSELVVYCRPVPFDEESKVLAAAVSLPKLSGGAESAWKGTGLGKTLPHALPVFPVPAPLTCRLQPAAALCSWAEREVGGQRMLEESPEFRQKQLVQGAA